MSSSQREALVHELDTYKEWLDQGKITNESHTKLSNKAVNDYLGASTETPHAEVSPPDDTPTALNEGQSTGITTSSPIDEQARNDLVKRILDVAKERDWNPILIDTKAARYYRFKKNDVCIPIILEDHANDEHTKPGYLTTDGYNNDEMVWKDHKSWSSTNVSNYIKNTDELGWVKFNPRGRLGRKRVDPLTFEKEEIHKLLEKFETIHE